MPKQGHEKPVQKIGSYQVRFTVTAAVIIGLLAIGLLILYAAVSTWRAQLGFVAVVLAGSAALYSAFYAGATARQRARQDRLRDTMELVGRVDQIELVKVRAKLEQEIRVHSIPPGELDERIRSNIEHHTAVRALLNTFEDIAVSIQAGFADEEVAYRSIGTLLMWTADAFRPYIDGARQRRGGDPTVFAELVRLAGSWKSGKYLTTGENIRTGD